ncbi:unnamed protein product [Pneumocystis jirovecii]|uniref:mitogen-activated protein kinase kinase kinase n=2 Tax=Pneumocystis jirovecii TaxID=42068 RepID=L0PA90_PNEJI|nr:uncharacterized protein T551_00958 [Pneumocystis jirovecii RU7]KTW31697.1 hypothetical protein T551_00958 [Pneumocystis jirovecii RU7]CCJ28999.1 unnamed protein product [Pneumocystis jirovecii]
MNYLDEVKLWNEEKVGEWLKLNDFGFYTSVFYDNNINGDILLDCDATLLKELGIHKLSDRIRLLVCIKKLRNKCIASARKAKLGIFVPVVKSSDVTIAQQSPTDPLIPCKPCDSLETSSGLYLDYHYSDTQSIDSLNNYTSGISNMPSTIQSLSKDLCSDIVKNSEKPPIPEINFMDISSVKNSPSSTDGDLSKVFKKFNTFDESTEWNVYDAQNSKSSECIFNDAFLPVPSQHSKLEQEGSTLKRVPSSSTSDTFTVSQIAAKEQDFVYGTTVMAKTTGNLRKLETFFGEKIEHTFASPNVSPLPSPSYKDKFLGTKRIRNFFGQRPPSEHISSNLTEYFPGHEKKVLEQTVRNSIRKLTHPGVIKRSNLNISSSLPYGISSMPTAGRRWVRLGGQKLSESSRRFSLSYFVSTQFSALLEAAPSKENIFRPLASPSKSDPGYSTNITRSGFSIEKNISDIKLDSKDSDDKDSFIGTLKSRSCALGGSLILSDSCDASVGITRGSLDGNIFENSVIKDLDIEKGTGNNNSGPTRWIKGALIGSGSFGSVFLGMNALSGELMAVKQVEIPSYDIQGCKRKIAMLDALQREISLLKELHHENIVQYLGSSMDETHLTFFLEYVPGGSVTALLNNYGAFEEPLIRNFVRQILKGLNYLHNKKIIHRDIKGANILVDNKGVIKISDFGISKKVEANLLSISKNHRPSLQGSVYWMAPEVVKQTLYTRKADIWSLGCLVVEMFTGEHPFPKMNQLQAIFKIGQYASPEIPEYCTIEARQFLEKTFEPDYHARPTAADLLKSSFLGPIVPSPQPYTKK